VQSAFPGGLQEIAQLFQVPGRTGLSAFGGGGFGGGGGGGGGGFGGGGAPLATTGDYLVTLRVGNEVQRQVLRVEHVRDAMGPIMGNFQNDEEEEEYDQAIKPEPQTAKKRQ
jgi:hypothetical protein